MINQFLAWFQSQLPPAPTKPAGIETTCDYFFWKMTPENHRAKHLRPPPGMPDTCISGDAFDLLKELGIDPLKGSFPTLDENTSPALKELVAYWVAMRFAQ